MRTITITLRRGRHATQPWSFSIDDPGPGPALTVRERYSTSKAAKRGALRKLGIWNGVLGGRHSLQRGKRSYTVTFKTI